MKKIMLCLLMASIVMSSCAAGDKLHVKVDSKSVSGDTLVVMGLQDEAPRQRVAGSKGQFDFMVDVPAVERIVLLEPAGLYSGRSVYYVIPAVPGEEVVVTDTGDGRYDITGSRFYQQYHEADLAEEAVKKEINDLVARCHKLMANGSPQDSVMQVYQTAMPSLQQKRAQAILGFIKAHPDYEASAAIIAELPTVELMRQGVDLLSDEVRSGRVKLLYATVISQMEERQKAEQEVQQKQATGVVAPDFTLNDINGKPLALSSLKGKYVIIDFWGSWCGWCIKGFPKMKEYYAKYKDKLEILGVDCNDPEPKWRDAVKRHELPWLHVYNPRQSDVLAKYGVQGFPTKVIVGPDGKIVKTIVGEDPAFYTLLDQLFQ